MHKNKIQTSICLGKYSEKLRTKTIEELREQYFGCETTYDAYMLDIKINKTLAIRYEFSEGNDKLYLEQYLFQY